MSTPEVPFPYTETQVTEVFGTLRAPEDLDIYDQKKLFWNTDPTGIWTSKIRQADELLEAGIEVITVTGRHGVGKSEQFKNDIGRESGIEIAYVDGRRRSWIAEALNEPIVAIDEAQGLTVDPMYTGEWLAGTVLRKSQVVLIFPSTSLSSRLEARDQVVGDIVNSRPQTTLAHLEDVPKAPMQTDKTAYYLSRLGVARSTIDLVNSVSGLREPRIFNYIFEKGAFTEVADMEDGDLIEALSASMNPWGQEAQQAFGAGRWINICSLLWTQADVGHGLLVSPDLTMDQSKELYELAGKPLPVFSDTDIQSLAFDPYQKD